MFICLECELVFEEPKEYFETHGFSYGPYERFTCCPACGGDYSDSEVCVLCGKVEAVEDMQIYTDEETGVNHRFCKRCCGEEQC